MIAGVLTASVVSLLIYACLSAESDHPLLVLREKSLTSPECGKSWREQYARLQDDIRSGRSPQRYLVAAHDGQGANDRLTSIITGLLAAVVSDRAFFVTTFNHIPEFKLAFDSPELNALTNDTFQLAYQHLRETKSNGPLELKYRDSPPLFDETEKMYNDSMAKLYSDIPILYFNSNRGNSYGLIKESKHGEKLRAAGLNPAYGFNCAFHFLFKPNAEMLHMANGLTEPFKDKTTIKIGIQIRAGDDIFGQTESNKGVNSSHYYENFFNCAAYLEQTRIQEEHPGKKVLWYLISDSLPLKQDAKKMFGDKLIANHVDRPEHTGHSGSNVGHSLRLLFAEQITLSLCDYFIISHNSHVGRLAIWISEKGASGVNGYYEHRDFVLDRHQPTCKQFKRNSDTSKLGAGI